MSARRNIWIPPELYVEVVKAAAHEQASTGQQVSVAEWIREAIRLRLAHAHPDSRST